MKNLTLIIGGIILLLNVAIGLIFSAYKPFNIVLNSVIIIVNTLILYSLSVIQIKDGFRIALPFLFLIAATIEFLLGFFVPETLENSITLTMLILLFTGQVILYAIAYFVSKIS